MEHHSSRSIAVQAMNGLVFFKGDSIHWSVLVCSLALIRGNIIAKVCLNCWCWRCWMTVPNDGDDDDDALPTHQSVQQRDAESHSAEKGWTYGEVELNESRWMKYSVSQIWSGAWKMQWRYFEWKIRFRTRGLIAWMHFEISSAFIVTCAAYKPHRVLKLYLIDEDAFWTPYFPTIASTRLQVIIPWLCHERIT